MKIKEMIDMVRIQVRGRRKAGRILFRLFFLAMLVYFLVSSMTASVNRVVRMARETPQAQNIIYEDAGGELYEKLTEICEGKEEVSEIYPYIYPLSVNVDGFGERGTTVLELKSCSRNYEEYLVEGRLPKEQEILIPHYIYGEEKNSYEDGSELLGKTLTVTVEDRIGGTHTAEYVVSGTYDNIYAVTGNSTAFLYQEDAVKTYCESMTGIEAQLEDAMQKNGDYDRSHYIGFEETYYYAVAVKNPESRNEIRDEISDKLQLYGNYEIRESSSGPEQIFSVVNFIGMLAVMILLVCVILLLFVLIRNDVAGRRKEICIYMLEGYRKKDLASATGLEYAVFLAAAFVATVPSVYLLLFLENLFIRHMLPMQYGMLHMEFSWGHFPAGFVIFAAAAATAFCTAGLQYKKLNLQDVLREEG